MNDGNYIDRRLELLPDQPPDAHYFAQWLREELDRDEYEAEESGDKLEYAKDALEAIARGVRPQEFWQHMGWKTKDG